MEIERDLDKSMLNIADAIMVTLLITPPELAADICNSGVYPAGGGAFLRGLDTRISKKTDLPVHIAKDPFQGP